MRPLILIAALAALWAITNRKASASASVGYVAAVVFAYTVRFWWRPFLRWGLVAGIVFALVMSWSHRSVSAPVFVPVGLIVLLGFLRREIGSPRPRFLGVPRPDAIEERVGPGEVTSDDGPSLVDALDSLWGSTRPGGSRAGRRAVQTNGTCLSGRFEAEELPEHLRVAPFDESRVFGVRARFSNFSGAVERNDALRAPRGLAVRMEGTDECPGLDLVLVDAPRFPVSNRDDFYGFVQRYGRWARFGSFVLSDRSSGRALKALVPLFAPTSYATRSYHSLNTFEWGRGREPVRFFAKRRARFAAPAVGDPRNRLERDLANRVSIESPVMFDVYVVIGRTLPPAVRYDPRRRWPRWAPRHRLGTLLLDRMELDAETEGWAFDPHRLPLGVGPSRDEILMARRAAYAESVIRRCPL